MQELKMHKMSEIKKINSFYSKYKGEKIHEIMLKFLKAGEDVFECLTLIQDDITYLENLDDAIQLKGSVYLTVGISLALSIISLFRCGSISRSIFLSNVSNVSK